MKTKKEIEEEIKSFENTIKNYRKAVANGKFPKEELPNIIRENQAGISALLWVLGENDRFD
ncbi:hypothetical protein P4493_04660 [Bacillus thuringiensis]|jgi:hypothetical protein|uniref:Uncharacterized protein n=3 Tax=Bacillus thuringiensis TaxID=1428 RepID=A0A0B5NCE1_BACTU|nr:MULTISPECIES: hypothetical protein [Bacillus]MEC2535169.1 hypothetical protein [Bacillus cereus]MED1153716.1 hypothetical protein [Bacillus paranthracis]OUB09411.1 hypothetical protein BK708_33360 [Bacillus thuringiensis serovar yunnanensis]AFQ30036.1 hypothetical protein BTF1_29677 [Bacillus thuringiensis HD-789]AJG74055.1 hypothetical protein BF38_5830 [Bacillus thuringiensis]